MSRGSRPLKQTTAFRHRETQGTHKRATRSMPVVQQTIIPLFPLRPMPLHIRHELPLTLPLPPISTTSSRPCVRGVPSTHFSSLRQLGEMPSLAGLKSRAQLASFTRLDDGAFCRVISASLWAPPTPVATPGQPAAPKQMVQLALRTVSWHLLCHWPLACLFFCLSRLTEHLFLPLC